MMYLRACLLLICTLSLSAAVFEIGVVRSWQDLMDQPAVALPGGGSAHLGIECQSIAAQQAIYLYCLTEGHQLQTVRTWIDDEEPLGPFVVSVASSNDLSGASSVSQAQALEDDSGLRTCLYRIAIAIADPVLYRISVRIDDGPVLARCEVRGTAAIHAWSRLELIDDEGEFEPVTEEDAVPLYRLRPVAWPAVPTWDGLWPSYMPEGEDFDPRNRLLPRAMPQQVGGLQLQRRGVVLRAESPWPMVTCRLDYHLLARYWVNGEARQLKGQPLDEFSDGGLVQEEERRCELLLEQLQKALGADPGDRIEVQLMYCEEGSRPLAEEELMEERVEMLADDDRPAHRLSPRVVLIGD